MHLVKVASIPGASPNITFVSKNLEKRIEKPGNKTKEDQTKVPPLRIELLQARITEGMHAADPNKEAAQDRLSQIGFFQKRITRTLHQTRRQLPREEKLVADVLLSAANDLIDPTRSNTPPAKDAHQQHATDLRPSHQQIDTLIDDKVANEQALSNQIAHIVSCMQMEAAKHPGSSLEAQQRRRSALMDFLCTVFNNEFESDYGRWASNIIIAACRTGVLVALWTLMRDGISFEVAKASKLSGDQGALDIPAVAAIAMAPVLNVMGGLSSYAQGTLNWHSGISRLALLAFNLSALAACYVAIPSAATATNVVGNGLYAYIIYNALRDLANMFFPIRDNLTSLPVRAVGLSAVFYSIFQWAFGVPMSLTAPHAGSGALPQAIGNATVSREALAAAKFDWWQSTTHSTGNAIVEFLDDLILPYLAMYAQNRSYRLEFASDMRDEVIHKKYIEELTIFGKDLIKRPASERQKLIDKLNYSLYERELERLTPLRDKLDDERKLYLNSLQQEFLLFHNTIKLTNLWASWDVNRDALDLKDLDYLTDLEWQLGVYKKPRELARLEYLEGLDPTPLDDAQIERLTGLRLDIEKEFHELQALLEESDDELDADDRKRIESLQYQFSENNNLNPPTMRPIGVLMSGATRKVPDFSQFDEEIDRECRRRAPSFNKQKRKIVQEELYVFQFLKTYLPQISTPLEEKVRASIEEKRCILPMRGVKDMVLEVEIKRREDTEGLRLRLQPFSRPESWAEAIGRKILVTNAARQSAFATVIEALVALSFAIPEDGDDTTQAYVANAIVAFVILMCYMPLILTHMEGASPGRPVRRPGAQSLPRVREHHGEVDSPFTPRERKGDAGKGEAENGDEQKSGVPKKDERDLSEALDPSEGEIPLVERGKAEGEDDYSGTSDAENDDSSEPEGDPYEPSQVVVAGPGAREREVEGRPINKKLERQDTVVVNLKALLQQ